MPEMGEGVAFTTLQARGDVVEQRATENAVIAKSVCRYAALWANYVLPARVPDDPARVSGRFKDVAELSYSALVRLLSAAEAVERIGAACELLLESEDGLALGILRAHEGLFAFFCNAGAAVDLLKKAAGEIGPSTAVIFQAPEDQWGSANWFYKRRSGYIHERITPIFTISGLLHLDIAVLKQKDPSWEASAATPREISELVAELLRHLDEELATGWAKLHQLLRAIAPSAIAVTGPITRMSSASPR